MVLCWPRVQSPNLSSFLYRRKAEEMLLLMVNLCRAKGRQAFMHCIRLAEFVKEKANLWERLQNQQNHCVPGAAGRG